MYGSEWVSERAARLGQCYRLLAEIDDSRFRGVQALVNHDLPATLGAAIHIGKEVSELITLLNGLIDE